MLLVCLLAAQLSAADLNEEFFTAARKGDLAAVRTLLDKGVEVNAKWRYGTTALLMAARNGHAGVVRLLLDRGADVTVKDSFYGMTAVSSALFKDHTAVVKLLLEKGAPGGEDALLAGVDGNNTELVKIALEHGNPPERAKSRALSRARKAGRAEIAEVLEKAGATPLPEPTFVVPPETLARYAGTYREPRGDEVVLTVEDGKLAASYFGRRLVLGAFDEVTFQPAGMDEVTVVFGVENGRAARVSVRQGGASTEFTRVEAQ